MKKLIQILSGFILLSILTSYTYSQNLPTWQRAYNDPAGKWNQCKGYDCCQLRNGNLIITTETAPKIIPPEPPSSGIFVLNPYGDIIDSIHYYNYYANIVLATSDNGCIIMGSTENTQDDMFAMKLDSLGHQKWVKHYDNTPTVVCYGATKTSDNNFFAVGQRYYDYSYIIKIDSNGNRLWQRYYTKGMGNTFYYTVCDVGDGTYLAGGNYETSENYLQAYVTHFDNNGNIISEKEYKYNDYPFLITKINKLNPNSYLLTGVHFDLSIHKDIITMIKIDSTGNIISKYPLPQIPGYELASYGCEVLNEGKYIMLNHKYIIGGDLFSFAQIVDSSGNVLSTQTYGAGGNVTVDLRKFHKLLGNQFLFIGISDTRVSYLNDAFVVRADSNLYAPPCGINDSTAILPEKYLLLTAYPNPFNASVNIKFIIPEKAEYSLSVYNVLGQKIKGVFNETFTRGEYERQINLSSFSSGMYFVRLSSDKFNVIKKIILVK
jgi:hypothetical protein